MRFTAPSLPLTRPGAVAAPSRFRGSSSMMGEPAEAACRPTASASKGFRMDVATRGSRDVPPAPSSVRSSTMASASRGSSPHVPTASAPPRFPRVAEHVIGRRGPAAENGQSIERARFGDAARFAPGRAIAPIGRQRGFAFGGERGGWEDAACASVPGGDRGAPPCVLACAVAGRRGGPPCSSRLDGGGRRGGRGLSIRSCAPSAGPRLSGFRGDAPAPGPRAAPPGEGGAGPRAEAGGLGGKNFPRKPLDGRRAAV